MTMPTHIPRDPREYWGKAIADMRQTNQILKEEQEQTKRHLKALHIINRTSRSHIQEMQQEQQDLMCKLTEMLAAAAPSNSRIPSTKLSTKLNKVPFSGSQLPQPPPGLDLPEGPDTGEGITNEVPVLSPSNLPKTKLAFIEPVGLSLSIDANPMECGNVIKARLERAPEYRLGFQSDSTPSQSHDLLDQSLGFLRHMKKDVPTQSFAPSEHNVASELSSKKKMS